MLTSAGRPDSIESLKFNTFADGLFHASNYVLTALGVHVLWRSSRRPHPRWLGKDLVGNILLGFDIFNVVQGTVNHRQLGIHHVNETVAHDQWVYWDVSFLLWCGGMLEAGLVLPRSCASYPLGK